MINALRHSIEESTTHPIGCKPPGKYPMPPETHVYGLEGHHDQEGVDIITRSWKEHVKSKAHAKADDYIRKNINEVRKRSKEGKNIRKSCEIKSRSCKEIKMEDMVFGMKNRPSTPIGDVINFEYANRAEKILLKKYEDFIQKKKVKVSQLPKTNKYFESLIKARKEQERLAKEVKEPFKMKKFKNIKARVVLPKIPRTAPHKSP